MAKYSLQSNRNQTQSGEWFLVGAFAFASLLFLVLPLFKNSLQSTWRWVSLSTLAFKSHDIVATNAAECIVIAVPPQKAYDTVMLECDPHVHHKVGQFVWYREGAARYMVGRVSSVAGPSVVARLYSTSSQTTPIDVRFQSMPERFSAVPLGGGTLRVEIPADSAVQAGETVKHAVSGQLLGIVSGVRVEKGSYVKRVYIRLPFSFEKLTRLEVE